MQGKSFVAVMGVSLVCSAAAYADTGKSPNGAPGPAGNPNPPAAQPQANGPQGPAGNDAQGQSQASHGKSDASHGKSGASHGKSQAKHPASRPTTKHGNHANPTPGTPRKGGSGNKGKSEGKGGQNNFGHGKITICHATKSVKNPYVEITISVNGLHGHGPADDPRHHEGSWQDIIPAPAGGCPTTPEPQQQSQKQSQNSTPQTTTTTTTPPQAGVLGAFVALPEVAKTAPAGASAVLGEQAAGGSEPKSGVLGASASGGNAPAAATATRSTDSGSLPFTGSNLVFVLIVAAIALLGGFALRRALSTES